MIQMASVVFDCGCSKLVLATRSDSDIRYYILNHASDAYAYGSNLYQIQN